MSENMQHSVGGRWEQPRVGNAGPQAVKGVR